MTVKIDDVGYPSFHFDYIVEFSECSDHTYISCFKFGIEFECGSPRYIFTGLNPLKVEMIRAATENAKLRADQLARSTGRDVGAPVSARVGVFQIRPLHSQEVSDYGINDQSSIDKEIVCTVHINFLIE